MFLALIAHDTTVIPVEVVQVGAIVMGCCAGVGSTTGIVTPGSTLERGRGKGGYFMLLNSIVLMRVKRPAFKMIL